RVAVLVGDPHVVLAVDRDAVRLVLVPDDIVSDRSHQLVVLIELEELWLTGRVTLQGPEVTPRVDRDAGDATATGRQRERIGVGDAGIGRARLVRDEVALGAPGAVRRLAAWLRPADALNLRERRSCCR